MKQHIKAEEIELLFISQKNDVQRNILSRFFKTGVGQYGEGDEFLGLKVPQTREIVKHAKLQVSFSEIQKLLVSKWHEVRLCGLLLLVEEMKVNLPRKTDKSEILDIKASQRQRIAQFYLQNTRAVNNWDLVDLSCEYILGPYLRFSGSDNYNILEQLAQSDNLWEQRIAIVTTLDFIRNGIYVPTLVLSKKLLKHKHDLIHKAIGWVLREVGKKDKDLLLEFLETNYYDLPRTTLRYAIEKFPEGERKQWLNRM
ncbi:MAG: DNA alkylation repair protein [Muribaculaceae bacterium]|nr:DNA alkylation repair protein [Muribaculaceae bacterium]